MTLVIIPIYAMDANGPATDSDETPTNHEEMLNEKLRNLTPIVTPPQETFLENIDVVRSHAAGVLKLASDGDLPGAFALMSANTLVPQAEMDEAEALTVKQLAQVAPRFGRTIGYEVVGERMVGDSLVRISGIVKHENIPVRWMFYYYKPQDKWILFKFNWDDKPYLLFEN